ncbi:MAG: trehalase family glycosidase [Planctomycetota bacterium]|nr:trehalase family glycosidase [Planctomycetota bacterium]
MRPARIARGRLLAAALVGAWAAAVTMAAETAQPRIGPNDPWGVERAGTTAYPQWLQAATGVREELKSMLASEQGNLQYWIRVPKGAKGTVVVAVGEAHWAQPGKRIMDVLIDGQKRASGVDPIAVAGGPHRLAAVLCPAEDLDGDGLLHIQIVAATSSPDKVTLAAGLWWLARTDLTQAEANELLKPDGKLKADVFIPGIPEQQDLAALKARFAANVETEDAALNSLIGKLYGDCVLSKLFAPQPPALPHKWFSPGGGYVGQWVWDTMFVAIAYAPLDDDETIREVFENYWYTIENNPEAPKGSYRYGMVPNFLKPWPPLGYSQIPILAWGCQKVFQQTNDRRLIERALPYLVAFDEWYSTERDTDGDLLIEYGAYKDVGAGMLQTARYETFDLHVTLDDMKMTRHPRRNEGGEWYGNVDAVEQTCFLLMSERAIVDMARLLGNTELAQRYEQTVARRIKAMQDKMWDADKGFFYSLDRDSDRKIPAKTIQGFLTMACNAATKDQGAILAGQLKDPKQWWCEYPVPTCALDDPKFDPKGFWRGDMWPATTYLVAYGLCRYGYHDLARELTDKMRLLIAEKGINERYNSRTGQPLGVPGLGMTCSIWSMIVQNVYGVQDDFRTIRVPPGAKGRKLKLGKLRVAYPDDDAVELMSAFEREFRVIVPGAADVQPLVSCDGKPLEAGELKHVDGAAVFKAAPAHTYRVSAGKK